MIKQSQHVLTLANSIIGVSILAMPYCFKQCGVLLAIIILLLSNLMSRLSCHFLIKSAIIARRKTFEYLAYYIFGSLGKFGIEIGIIGFLIGTCIAFFVVMGDLGPEIISEISGHSTSSTMRSSILMALALFCVLPLGLLRNIDSLSGVSRATIGFYVCLIIKIIVEALPHLFSGDWINKVEIWRPAGVIQCLPIFSMALSCQTQLFEIYQVVINPTLDKMNYIVKSAVNICTLVYFFVGFFGYIAFAKENFTGNVLISFAPSLLTNVIKIGFILSIAFSFPLVIFPCRASIHSLLYKEGFSMHEGVSNYIPEGRFKGLTMIIVFISLIVGILIPNIELVLGLVGSTIGIIICVLFPVICFIHISEKNSNERLLAKLVLVVGLILMVLGTYENLHSLEKIEFSPLTENFKTEKRDFKIVDPAAKDLVNNVLVELEVKPTGTNKDNSKIKVNENITEGPNIKPEPPQPIEPQEMLANLKKVKNKTILEKTPGKEIPVSNLLLVPNPELEAEAENEDNKIQPKLDVPIQTANKSRIDQVGIEIKKNEQESPIQQKNDPHLEEHKILLDTIQKQNEVQEEIVKQQKKLIEVIEKQQDQKAQEQKLKAVKEIETIALKALEKISGDAKNNDKVVAELKKDVNKKISSNENDFDTNIQQKKELNEDPAILKIDNFKLSNMLLGSKMKNNNTFMKNDVVYFKNNTGENTLNIEKSFQNNVFINKSKTLDDTGPLFENLGQKNNEGSRQQSIEYKPPPVEIPSQQIINNSVNEKMLPNIKPVGEHQKPLETHNNELFNEDAKVMRREILAHMEKKS